MEMMTMKAYITTRPLGDSVYQLDQYGSVTWDQARRATERAALAEAQRLNEAEPRFCLSARRLNRLARGIYPSFPSASFQARRAAEARGALAEALAEFCK